MKKIVLLGLVFSLTIGLKGQIKLGLNGGLYNTYVINKNINDPDNFIESQSTFQGMYGLGATIMLGDKIGLSTGLNVLKYKQILDGEFTQNIGPIEIPARYNLELELDYTSIPVYIRTKTLWGLYIESGLQFNFMNTASETLDYLNEDGSINFSNGEISVSDDFSDFVLALGFGIGFDFGLSEKLFLNAGLDFSYSLSDTSVMYSEEELVQNAVGAYSLASHLGVIDNSPIAVDLGEYDYESSNNANAGLKVGLYYKL